MMMSRAEDQDLVLEQVANKDNRILIIITLSRVVRRIRSLSQIRLLSSGRSIVPVLWPYFHVRIVRTSHFSFRDRI